MLEEDKIFVQFEMTSPNTPQQNGKVERKFATLYSKVRAMLKQAGFNQQMKNSLWPDAAREATDIENNLVTQYKTTSSFRQFFPNRKEIHIGKRIIFGSVAVVANMVGQNVKSKLGDRGFSCVYIGRSIDHTDDTYKFYNINTQARIQSRDVKWLDKLYGEWCNNKGESETNITFNKRFSLIPKRLHHYLHQGRNFLIRSSPIFC